jgi:hypothetical protein
MTKVGKILLVAGLLLIAASAIFIHRSPGVSFREMFSFEPKYEGHTFTYWMEHWNRGGAAGKNEAESALRAVGPDAVPYLTKWILQPPTYGSGFEPPERALAAFKILGPEAKTAVPALVKAIGQNNSYPERALVCIGGDAIPALTNRLIETLSDTNYPLVNGPIRTEVRKTSGYYMRGCILNVLDAMGTNAEPAIPALVTIVTADLPSYALAPNRPNPYRVLANVGRNHPDVVMGALQQKEARTNLPQWERNDIDGAKAALGKEPTGRPFLEVTAPP